jgi:DNA-binding response OmpR family regulator
MARQRILIVEDDPTVVDLVTEILTASNFEVRAIDSAFGAAELVRQLEPGAILLDLGLPFRPGSSLMSDLKADPRTADVPIIILSGLTEALTDSRRELAAAVVTKPFEAAVLVETVRKAVS